MKFARGTRVYYLEVDQFDRRTRKRPPEHAVGNVLGERDSRGAGVKWSDGFVRSVLWDWIDDQPPQPENPHDGHAISPTLAAATKS